MYSTPSSSDSLFQVKSGDIIESKTTQYGVVKFKGEGTFGKVAKCLDFNTLKTVALKVLKDDEEEYVQQELEMLRAIKVLDPDQYNIVSFIEHFKYCELSFLSFEMLDKSLWDFMEERKWAPLPLNDIRYVTKQFLVALDGLKSIGIMHTDLKLDNIMLVNHQYEPFKIKLIDFGLAMRECQAEDGMIMQHCAYRAPEVTLGLPLTTAVDMWGLGCIIAELFFGLNIFPFNCEYNNMRAIVSLLGYFDEYELNRAMYSYMYFTKGLGGICRLRSPEEYNVVSGNISEYEHSLCDDFRTIDEAVLSQPGCQDAAEYSDRMAFLYFLKCCLDLDANQRISPRRALAHCFITNTGIDQMQGGICGDSDSEAACNSRADHPVLDININTKYSNSGIERPSSWESYNERPVSIEPCAPPKPQFFDVIIPDGLVSENEADGATPNRAESGNHVAAASDSACLIDDQVRASQPERNVNQEEKEADTTSVMLEVIRHLSKTVSDLQHNYDEVKRLFEVEQASTKALREEIRLMKENIQMQANTNTSATSSPQENMPAPQDLTEEEKEQHEELKDLGEQVVEPAPELSQVNGSQGLDVSEQPVPIKMKKRLPWWKRMKNFFTRGRRQRESESLINQ